MGKWRKVEHVSTGNDGVKRSNMGKPNGVATPHGRSHFCEDAFACGQRSRASGHDVAMEHFCEDEATKENSSNLPCAVCSPIPPTLDVPPLACMTRGQQDLHGWWRKSSSKKVLGDMKECMQSLAQQCLLAVQAPQTTTLRVLSLSDGSANDCTMVPTSVLLSHAFASLGRNALPHDLQQVKIVGGDVWNSSFQCQCDESQTRSPWLPPWLKLQHVHLDNKKNFKSQVYKFGQGQHTAKFDVILMRQGLCYCNDHSFECLPPEKLELSGIQGDGSCDGPSGTYALEPVFRNRRPSYRKGKFVLHWRPACKDWVIEEDSPPHFVWANVVKDFGSPALAQTPWYGWDGKDYVIDENISCEVIGPSPWKRPPHACTCCGGISLDATAMQSFMGRIAAVLDDHNPKSFALLQGGCYIGTRDDVEKFELELEKAAERFNSTNHRILATILRKREKNDWTTAGCACISGLLLSPSL